LRDFGYGDNDLSANLIAFQRHFEPEAFIEERVGEITGRGKKRLYALLAGHVIPRRESDDD
jgi:hypothetical protein